MIFVLLKLDENDDSEEEEEEDTSYGHSYRRGRGHSGLYSRGAVGGMLHKKYAKPAQEATTKTVCIFSYLFTCFIPFVLLD